MAPLSAADAKEVLPSRRAPAQVPDEGNGEIDLDVWRLDLRRLHGSMDTAVQTFIATQTRQLDLVANELSAQMERLSMKERCFAELGDSIAGFVEAEVARTELWGLPLEDAEADARHEAYDAELPGPPALHRINRQWRKMTRAFEVMKEVNEREGSKALSDERSRLEAQIAAAEERCETLRLEHATEVEALKLHIASSQELGTMTEQEKDNEVKALAAELETMTEQHAASEVQLALMAKQLEQVGAAHNRADYEWEAEREELIRERAGAQSCVEELKKTIEASQKHEAELAHQCAERDGKLEQMKSIMDEQERAMTTKIERVQQYVKERQAGALAAEKKQQDADRMSERWQREVQRLQAEKDRLAAVVLDLETNKVGQVKHFQGAHDLHQQEVTRLQETLQKKEEEMRSANMELLEKRDAEYQNKINLDRQREKDRSIALLNKKQQEVQLKEVQLKAARQRIQELETGVPSLGAQSGHGAASPGSRGSSAGRRPSGGEGKEASLPKLPQSAR